jgi:cytochrome bd-type quinol oxidase subunit 2
MEVLRTVYRFPLIEGILLLCVTFQVTSGLTFVFRGWKTRTCWVPWLQAGSGLVLAFFLIVHVSAVMFGRAVLNLDTNFHYAAAGLHVPPNHLIFIPYYFVAVVALFAHLGCSAYWQLQKAATRTRTLVVVLTLVVGTGVSLLITLSLAGKIQPVEIPAIYKSTYGK